MNIEGWYYLHTTGNLIYKPSNDAASDIRESDFARAMWACVPSDRTAAWGILVEALSLGANGERVRGLAKGWGCDDRDAAEYANRIGLTLKMDGSQWCAHPANHINIQEGPAGFGPTALDAMADLCVALGFTGGKMGWHATFGQLVEAANG